jgi:hypothetical protein
MAALPTYTSMGPKSGSSSLAMSTCQVQPESRSSVTTSMPSASRRFTMA